jgi:hypothetical protein
VTRIHYLNNIITFNEQTGPTLSIKDTMWNHTDRSFIERVSEAMGEALFVVVATILMFPYIVWDIIKNDLAI